MEVKWRIKLPPCAIIVHASTEPKPGRHMSVVIGF